MNEYNFRKEGLIKEEGRVFPAIVASIVVGILLVIILYSSLGR